MKRFFPLSIIIYLLLILGLVSFRGGFIALAFPFLLYLVAGFLNNPAPLDLHIERRLSVDRASPGSVVDVTLKVVNRGRDIDELMIEDDVPPSLEVSAGAYRHFLTLPGGAAQTYTYSVRGGRGKYIFDTVKVTARDHLGLTRVTATHDAYNQLSILPGIRGLRSISIHPRSTRVYAGTIPAHIGGTGVEFHGVRDYQIGDSPRSINWRVSARHPETLYSNEFHQERVADVGVILDAREQVNLFHKGMSIFDHSAHAAGTLANTFIAQGNRVGLLVYGSFLAWTLPGYGRVQRERILHAIAAAEVGTSSIFADLAYLPSRLFPPQSQIVLVSPLLNADLKTLIQLRARGYQVMVICPDPVEFEIKLLPQTPDVDLGVRILRLERNLFFRRLKRAGIQAYLWDVSVPLDQAIGPALKHSPAHHLNRFM